MLVGGGPVNATVPHSKGLRMQRNLKLVVVSSAFAAVILIPVIYFTSFRRDVGISPPNRVTLNATERRSTENYFIAELLAPHAVNEDRLKRIANLIHDTVAPDTWIGRGGISTILVDTSLGGFVVHQGEIEHKRIEELLVSIQQLVSEQGVDVLDTLPQA